MRSEHSRRGQNLKRKEVLAMRNLPIRKDRGLRLFGEWDLDSIFEDFFRRPILLDPLSRDIVPRIDLYEKDNKVIVKAELPGVEPEKVDLSVDGNLLTIRGEKKQENEVKEKDYYRLERSYGSFERAVELPAAVNADETKATYRKGVLEIELPKVEEEKKKKIRINVK